MYKIMKINIKNMNNNNIKSMRNKSKILNNFKTKMIKTNTIIKIIFKM